VILLLRLAVRNARRNVVRTALTASTVALGTAVLTTALAWIGGVFGSIIETSANSVGHVRVVQPAYAAREDLFPLYENIANAREIVDTVSEIDGVTAAYPRIVSGVTVSAGDEIGEHFSLLYGADVAWFRERMDFDALMAAGTFFERPDDIVLGATIAERTGATVGGEVILLGQTQDGSISPLKGRVVGVVSAGTALMDQAAFVSLERMQYLADMDGGATEILVYAEHRDDAGELATRVAAEVGDLKAEAWSAREPWASLLSIVVVIRTTLAGFIVFITALGVWNTMMMSVMERTSEIGVLRAMGLTGRGTLFLFVSEALMIATLGGLLGVCIGGLGGAYLEIYGVSIGSDVTQNLSTDFPFQQTMYADMNLEVALTAFGLGMLMAVVGSALPSARAASIKPVEAMRTNR